MELIAALSDLCKEQARPIIAIDGPAGAGKTTLAHEIFLALSNSMSIQVIHMDDLYAGWDKALTEPWAARKIRLAEERDKAASRNDSCRTSDK